MNSLTDLCRHRVKPQVEPSQAVDILQDRMRQVGKLNTAIADWLQMPILGAYTESSELSHYCHTDRNHSVFSVSWDTLTDSTNTLADSHAALASKIEVDVELPLRNFVASSRGVTGLTTMQGNLRSMAKDVEAALAKVEKLGQKGDRVDSSKLADANHEVEETKAQWLSQAPYVFENLQEVDEARLNHLRDVLTQFETHEVDLVEKSRQTAEHCLNVLLQVETADEITTFALKAVASKPRQERVSRSSAGPSTPARGGTGSNMLAPIPSAQDGESIRSGSVHEDKKKNRFSAIKRMGTIVSGRNKRESRIPDVMAQLPEDSEKKSRSSPFSLGRRNQSKTKVPQLDTPLEEEPPMPSSSRRPSMAPQVGSEILELHDEPEPSYATNLPKRTSSIPPHANGDTLNILNGAHSNSIISGPPRDSEGYSVPPADVDPITAARQEANGTEEIGAPVYNVNIRDAPVQDSGTGSDAALATIANKLGPPVVSRAGTVRGRRQANRNSVIVGGPSIPEQPSVPVAAFNQQPYASTSQDNTAARASPSTVEASTLDAPAPQTMQQSPAATLPPGPTFPPSVGPASPFSPSAAFRPDSHSGVNSELSGADNRSIRSGRSLASVTSQGTKHPELSEIGLSSSIVETVNARFDSGKIFSSSVIGEVALAYHSSDSTPPASSATLRLDNFASLEKVAPNPAFIGTSSVAKEGEYVVDLSKLARTQVAFKYQVRTTEAGSHAPLLLHPAFRIEANQASIIVSYSLNPSFELHGRDSLTLNNVAIGLTLEGAVATACQSLLPVLPEETLARGRLTAAYEKLAVSRRFAAMAYVDFVARSLVAGFRTDTMGSIRAMKACDKVSEAAG
nr:cytoskeletal protein syp1 [Quercus suber]